MSLIIDALEKLQREAKPLAAITGYPVIERPNPVVFKTSQDDFVQLRVEEEPFSNQKKQVIFGLLFAACLFTAAVIGFEKISEGLALPQIQTASFSELNQTVRPAIVSQTEGPGVLRGVLQDPSGSFCILGEQILKAGDTWRGYTVLSIEAKQVVVQDTQNRLLTLYLQES